jgi:chemotaxis signal transduction protein
MCEMEMMSLETIEKSKEVVENVIILFCVNNYYEIMLEVDRVTTVTNVDKKDLLLEMDLYADPQKGSAPALREPPEFKIAPARGYLDGTRPDEPDWFDKGSTVYEENIRRMLACIRDRHERMTSNDILVLARYPDRNKGVVRIGLLIPNVTDVHLFSNESLAASSRAMKHDDSRLGAVFGRDKGNVIAVRRDFEKRQRLRDVMQQPNDLRLSIRINQFTQTDERRQGQEGFGDSDEDSHHSGEGEGY